MKERRLAALKVAGLFAGVGGLELGLTRAGHHTVMLCDVDAAAREVLKWRFSETPCYSDVREIRDLGEADLLVAGFPCQDLSQVGPRGGINGRKSGLVGEVLRLLENNRVDWVLLENVPFMLCLERGGGARWLLARLDAMGYRWAYREIDSRAFGVPQRRRRLYILAAKSQDPRGILLGANEREPRNDIDGDPKRACGFYWTEGNSGIGWAVDAVPTLKAGSAWGIASPPAIIRASEDVILPDIRDAERMQGFPEDWTKPAEKVARKNVRWRLATRWSPAFSSVKNMAHSAAMPVEKTMEQGCQNLRGTEVGI